MNVRWSPQALQDLANLRSYIAQHNPSAARKVAHLILYAVETLLADNPQIGRPGRVSGTRELVVKGTPYIVPYAIHGEFIHIHGVHHGARRWPDNF